ncbi:MAG: hypothetical protein K9J37_10725 [Saprospiraceae bacterium]|nr:hypothetical protein [Saprospiraceae bacterium]MCF8250379.1 hypothetical protein [Saprospiraceae bacterium]MCF8280384.1 hypothetical protein [Bacteroidales bacterium]MCF8312187.1 hypothetical protein [Saprospiraceae bacterium]MCF8441849.1 hypothetical protein [Saprospiraceae bacterium]
MVRIILPNPVIDGGNNLGTKHNGERPFRNEIDQKNYQSLFAVLEIKPFESVFDSHFKTLVQ